MVSVHPVVSELVEKGFFEDALFYCERLYELEKKEDYLYQIGWIYMIQKRFAQAISILEHYTGCESMYLRAKCYYEMGQFSEAEELLEMACESNPNECVYSLLGDIYKNSGRHLLACQMYKKGLEKAPHLWSLRRKLHELYDEEENNTPITHSKLSKEFLNNLRLWSKADYLCQHNDCNAFFEFYNYLQTQNQSILLNSPQIYYYLGFIYWKLFKYTKARDALEKCINKSPWNENYLILYIRILWNLKDHAELSRLSYRLFQEEKCSACTWIAVGSSFSLSKNHKQAITAYERALYLNPYNGMIASLIGYEYFTTNEIEMALKYYRIALKYNEYDYQAWESLGFISGLQKNYKVAISFYKRAIKLFPENFELYVNMSIAYQSLGDNNTAMNVFQDYIKFDPTNPRILLSMGVIYSKEGDPQEAIKCYETALLKGEPDAFIYTQLGKCYADIGNPVQATLYYNKAMMLNPPNISEIQKAIDTLPG